MEEDESDFKKNSLVDFEAKKIETKNKEKEIEKKKLSKKDYQSASSDSDSSDDDMRHIKNDIFTEAKEKVLVKQRYDQVLSNHEKDALKKVIVEEGNYKEQMLQLKRKKDSERGNIHNKYSFQRIELID